MSADENQALGRFLEDSTTYRIDTPNLPAPWEFIYQNRKMLLKVDQSGPVYAQAYPPNDILLFRRDGMQKHSGWLVWVQSPEIEGGAFTNFFRPNLISGSPAASPEDFSVTYAQEAAQYAFTREGLRMETELLVPRDAAAVVMKLRLKNRRATPLKLRVMPALAPYMNPAQLAPWDRPEWYLVSAFVREGRFGFRTRLMNMNSEPDKRRAAVLWMDERDLEYVEISLEKFVGQGTFENPESLWLPCLARPAVAAGGWGDDVRDNTIFGYPPVYAAQYDFELAPGEVRELTQVLEFLEPRDDGSLPCRDEAMKSHRFFNNSVYVAEKAAVKAFHDSFGALRRIETPDPELNHYINYWLPLQMNWVASLDRGWPSGMRGSRDSANDFTAMVPLDAAWSRSILLTLLSCQRSDGWFPRQYSALGRGGKHDLRGHVDAGCWVVELAYEYLCATRDFGLLEIDEPWLDSDGQSTAMEHLLRAVEYFLEQDRIGEHGLCKIGEGDWLDSVNRAGLLGRGESVTVTCQAIIALTQLIELLRHVEPRFRSLPAEELTQRYENRRSTFRQALRAHAFNPGGYFSSVFNDDGKWLFSDFDPDGRKRVYGPANWYAVSAGVAGSSHPGEPDMMDSVLGTLEFLKSEAGYRLYWPPMGDIPINHVGRSGSGDLPAGLWENGNVYNQGSHGFLGRALATAGKGDLLLDAILWLLPYDQGRHPTGNALTAPYAMVNCWQQVPGFMRRGGLNFLTGSTAMGLRMVYDWMLGIRPAMDGLIVDPCLPPQFKLVRAELKHLGHALHVSINNPHAHQTCATKVLINDVEAAVRRADPFSGRETVFIPDVLFRDGANELTVDM